MPQKTSLINYAYFKIIVIIINNHYYNLSDLEIIPVRVTIIASLDLSRIFLNCWLRYKCKQIIFCITPIDFVFFISYFWLSYMLLIKFMYKK